MPSPRPLHLGLTGNIASGKSAVAAQLSQLGAFVIDADVLAREAVAHGTPGFAAVVDHFGPDVVAADGTLDRAALRRRVFRDAQARDVLNGIVHPEVSRRRERQFAAAAARGERVVISDIPLLFEVGLEHAFDGVILVDAPVDTRRERLIRDRRLSAVDADAMMAAQWPSDRKRSGATWVIDNDGTREQLHARVSGLWRSILELADRRRSSASVS
jgi:dephospho-CoA kinase